MFDPAVEVATAAQLSGRIVATHARLLEAECEELVLAAAWADAHYLDPTGTRQGEYQPLIQRACAWGGDGCPQVSEYAAVELGALRGTGSTAARMLIGDALDLRHRHPVVRQLVTTGSVRAWQARAVAQTTHPLTWEQAVAVDGQLSGLLPMMPWPRFRRLLTAAVLQADPDGARGREDQAARSTGVWAWDGEHGLKTLVAKAAAGDVTCFLAAVNRIADILARDGDTDSADARRATAVGILDQPARALQLLLDHTTDPDPVGTPPDPEPGDRPDLAAPALPATTLARLADAARPRVVLHLHLSDTGLRTGDGLVRPEHGEPLTIPQAWDWLAATGCPVTLRPVLDPLATAPVDAYETPARLREALTLRNPVDVFPYGQATSRNPRRRPHHPLRPHRRRRATRPDRTPQPRTPHPTPPPRRHPRPLARTPTRPRHLPVPIPHRIPVRRHQPRHPPPRPQPLHRHPLAPRHERRHLAGTPRRDRGVICRRRLSHATRRAPRGRTRAGPSGRRD